MELNNEYGKLLKKLKRDTAHNKKITEDIALLRNKLKDTYDTENEVSKLSHNYKLGDIVVLTSREMARIDKLIKRKHYELFVQCLAFKSRIGTKRKIHEKEILCHAMDIAVEDLKEIKYKENGWRCSHE